MKRILAGLFVLIGCCGLLSSCQSKVEPVASLPIESTSALTEDNVTPLVQAKITFAAAGYNLELVLKNVEAKYSADKMYIKLDVLESDEAKDVVYQEDVENLLPINLEKVVRNTESPIKANAYDSYIMPKSYELKLNEQAACFTATDRAKLLKSAEAGANVRLRVTLYDPWGYVYRSAELELKDEK